MSLMILLFQPLGGGGELLYTQLPPSHLPLPSPPFSSFFSSSLSSPPIIVLPFFQVVSAEKFPLHIRKPASRVNMFRVATYHQTFSPQTEWERCRTMAWPGLFTVSDDLQLGWNEHPSFYFYHLSLVGR
ncbi:hypothetical protein B0H65DRAFT_468646 [Neurospora tetraspora]|uniref:Uncharacterized protein n=1 Tax=Neurospora tetraspora TaxID=94610 RepID=A0AAE0MRN5_9PEZI|nr:hypothetical protein B0H65DRAFT_468646 [Neurospora tetraspora]